MIPWYKLEYSFPLWEVTTSAAIRSEAIALCISNNVYSRLRINCYPVGESTPISITEKNIVTNTFSVDRYIESSDVFVYGGCQAAELSFSLLNDDGAYDNISFTDARLEVQYDICETPFTEGSRDTFYRISLGTFYIDEAPKKRTIMKIVAYDAMVKFDKLTSNPFINEPGFPVDAIINIACSEAGVTLGTTIDETLFPNDAYIPMGRPETGNASLRDYIRWCAEYLGAFAYINSDNKLVLVKEPYDITLNHGALRSANRFTSEYSDDVNVKATSAWLKSYDGKRTYYTTNDLTFPIVISNNPLLVSTMTTLPSILSNILAQSTSFWFTEFSAKTFKRPDFEPLDFIVWYKGEMSGEALFRSVVTHTNFKLNGSTLVECTVGNPKKQQSHFFNGSSDYGTLVPFTGHRIYDKDIQWNALQDGTVLWSQSPTVAGFTQTYGITCESYHEGGSSYRAYVQINGIDYSGYTTLNVTATNVIGIYETTLYIYNSSGSAVRTQTITSQTEQTYEIAIPSNAHMIVIMAHPDGSFYCSKIWLT